MKEVYALCSRLVLLFAVTLYGAESKPPSRQKAFPTAEGYGQYAKGGRGGKVIFVTNLNDSGPGSLRGAVEKTSGPRTVIFRVAGVIDLKSILRIMEPYITIAGQTAPGDGICLKGHCLHVDAHDTIIRYLRVRLGDEQHTQDDAIATYRGSYDTILDHCSASWSVDETLSATYAKNVTIQWCFITESLNRSSHTKGTHGYGSLINGWEVSYHHNLYAHHTTRVPRPAECMLDFRNNVLYDFGRGYNHNEKTKMNYVGNYIKFRGEPRVFSFQTEGTNPKFFFENNLHSQKPEATKDNTLLFRFQKEATVEAVRVDKPFPIELTTTHSPEEAYELVLAGAGATLPVRDAVDKRIVEQVKNGTGKILDSQNEVGGWPEYKSGPVPADGDNDGMPDEWEAKSGLNPKYAADGNSDADSDGYTNIEEFLNSTDPKAKD
jgi:pectate lyase